MENLQWPGIVGAKLFWIQCSTHQNNFASWTIGSKKFSGQQEQKIDIFVSFMHFIDDNVRPFCHGFLGNEHLDQEPRGHEHETGVFGGVFFVQAHFVSN